MANFVPVRSSRLEPPFIVGFHTYLSATSPDTIIELEAGVCSDSTNTIDIVAADAMTIDCATVGALGLDTGSLVASKVYYVHVIADSSKHNAPSAVVSLSIDDPVMPDGYDVKRMVDFKITDSSADLVPSSTIGPYADRVCVYENPITIHDTTGAAAFTAIALTVVAPAIDSVEVQCKCTLTPVAADDTLILRSTGATGNYAIMSGSVIGVAKTGDLNCLALANTSGYPSIDFKTNAAGTAVAVIDLKSVAFRV